MINNRSAIGGVASRFMGIQLKRVDMRLIVTGLAALALVACSSETKQETAITTPEAAAAPAEAAKTSCEAPKAAHHGKKKMKKHKAHKAAAKAEEVKKDESEAKADETKKEEKAEEKK